MISAGDFRNGKTLEIEGTVYQILEFQHVKPGKGAAFVRTKLKDIKNVQPRSSRRQELTVRICSICIRMEICTTSWTMIPMSRSHLEVS